jgi:hypothetical protein
MWYAKELCEKPNRVPGTLRMILPVDSMTEEEIVDRPLCHCNMPCEVKLSKDKSKIYFVCSLNNVWDNFIRVVDIGTPCNYFKRYTKII